MSGMAQMICTSDCGIQRHALGAIGESLASEVESRPQTTGTNGLSRSVLV